jgi:hypothetical protein
MTISGFELYITSDYGLELDSFLGAIYLPWHTIAIATALLIAYKIYKRKKNK